MSEFIPVNKPSLEGNEARYLKECIDSGWISSEGPFVGRLEREFAAAADRKWGIAVCNGSAALDAAVAALHLSPGDEVILPAFTIISCAAAIVRAGAVPVLVDSDPVTWNMRVDQIEQKLTPRSKAIMAVHIYGLPVDIQSVQSIAQRRGLAVIEDAAEALGAKCRNQSCGSFGDISTFSFYSNKLVTTGEGGMILCDDDELAARCRSLRNLCFQPGRRFVHEELGWNMRMSNLQAAVGVAQLERLGKSVERKQRIGSLYMELLEDVKGIRLPLPHTTDADNTYWVFGVMLENSIPFDAQTAMERLARCGIGTRPFFWPMHEQPVLKRMGFFAGETYPVAENLARRGFYLPSGLGISDEQVRRSAAALRDVLS